MFRKGRMKITVAKVFKISQGSMPPEPISQSYLVELSVSISFSSFLYLNVIILINMKGDHLDHVIFVISRIYELHK